MKQGRELLVGSVISAALVVGVVGTLWLKGTNFGETVTVVEIWANSAAQLTEGSPVVRLGVPIGRVSDIAVDTTGAFVRILLALEGEVRIEDAARGLISPQSLFGDWQMEIVTATAYPRAEFFEVRPGYTENGVRVLGGYALADISQLTEAADEISENLAVLTNRFDRAFNEETADAIAEAIRNLQNISQDVRELIAETTGGLERIGTQVERAATEVSAAATVGRGTLERLDELMARGQLDSVLMHIEATTHSLEEMAIELRQSTSRLGPVLERTDSTLQGVGRVFARIERGEGSLGRLMMDTTFAARAEGAMFQLEQLLADMKLNPGRYIRLSIF